MSFYHNYIGTLSIPTAEKEALLEPKMLSEHHLYLHLISYLAPAFPSISAAQLESLSLISYLDFRFDTLQWRQGAPALTEWHAAAVARPSFLATPVVDD